MVALFATGIVFGDGRQASHWKDDLGIGIMDPTAARGERLDISVPDLRAFDVLGYTAAVPEPATGILICAGLLLMLPTIRRVSRGRQERFISLG
jgi:hypothetical protein